MADEVKDVKMVKLTEADKRRLRDKALAAAEAEMREELEAAFLEQAKLEALEALKPKKPEEELVSILVDLPDMTGLLTDGKLYQHGREYVVTRTVYDDMRGRIANAWRAERELNNPFSGMKSYRPAVGNTILRGGEISGAARGSEHRY